MDYQDTLAYLYNSVPMFQQVGGAAYKEGLENTLELDAHLGHPHRRFRTIHVAGTNGKGSCSHTLAAILQEAGYRTGLYTSPHLLDFRERIRINGKPIPPEYVVNFVARERPFFEPLHPSFFELATAMAFRYFADEAVDVAVIEVGMGGRLDCTNIIRPDLCLITNISPDHTQFLGHTLAQIAAECGASGVVSAPPYYFATGQPELAEFYEELVPQLPLPVFLYNMPSHTKVNFAPATIHRIAQDPRVIGFKDSSANAVYFQSVMHIMKDRPDFAMLVGPEEITAECVLMGAHGGINGGANMFPKLYVDMYNAAKAGNLEEVRRLQPIIMQISSTIYTVGQHGSSYLKGLKCALSILGVCDDFIAAPFHKFNAPEREKIRLALEALPL